VAVPGARLGYRVAGHGPTLVLVTGSGSTMAEWDPRFVDPLTAGHRVIVFDNRGTGTSSGGVSSLTIALMARDTAALIARLAGGRADVLGWSMGGYVALQLAVDQPARVRRLVLASANPGSTMSTPPTPAALAVLTNPAATEAQRMSILFPPGKMASAGLWLGGVGAAFAANHYSPPTSFAIPPLTAAAQVRAAGALWLGRGRGVVTRLSSVKARVLVAGGRLDVVVPTANARLLLARLPHATSAIYVDAGHAFLFQRPAAFSARVLAFLK
jgi:pimeloyl-ACP methyl ester carboxylesterase